MWDLAVAGMTVATGFVCAGLIASFHQLVTDSPASFAVQADSFADKLWSAFLIVFCGPVILMRNGVRGRLIERRPGYWLVLTAMIAAGWSFCSGIFVLQVALAI